MGDQPQAIAELAEGIEAGERYQTLLGATGTGKTATMAWIVEQVQKPDAPDRAQQDARRPALQRVPRVLPRQRGRVLRLVLRLLPARGVRTAGRSLHRERLVAKRRHRPPAPRRDGRAALAPRRDHRRVGLLHLRPRLARGVREAGRLAEPVGEEHDRDLVLRKLIDIQYVAQRHPARPRPVPRQGRRGRGAGGAHGVGVPDLVLRRRGRADHALRPVDGRGLRRSSTTSRSSRRRST